MFLKIITNWGWTMYLHKENKELFRDIISIVSERKNVTTDIVEKNYYVTMILYLLSQKEIEIIFKGGTSLSKAYGVIDRFSEDIDITFKEHLGESRRKKLKYNILKPIAEDLEIEIKNWKDIESDKNYNHYDFYYNSVSDNSNFSGLSPFVKLETALMSYSFPTERRQISNYIYDTLKNEEPELIKKYNLIPFEMSVQCINRTLADKIFAVCDYYLQGKAQRNSRHLYDIFKLLNYVEIDEEFIDVTMSMSISPSEFEKIQTMVFNKSLESKLKNMFKHRADGRRLYARENIVEAAILVVIKERPKIYDEDVINGVVQLSYKKEV